jgi:hypothetical protein
MISLLEVYEDHCGRNGLMKDDHIALYLSMIIFLIGSENERDYADWRYQAQVKGRSVEFEDRGYGWDQGADDAGACSFDVYDTEYQEF